MEVEEHFAFKVTCEPEDDKKYNVYPTCKEATFRKDKDTDDENYDSDAEDSNYDSEAAEDSDYDPEEHMSPDNKDHSRSPTPRLPETDSTTEAKTANIEMQPKIIENPDLTASFSDEEVEVMSHNIVLPHPEYLFYFGWETDRGFHTDIPLRTTAYEFVRRLLLPD